jgi:NAD(P)-dependent dehydrogenase (short-subunit alcohol dehydrogenase family)
MASNPSFGATTGGLEVAETYKANVKGKTILITGVSTDGIGEGAVRAFAHSGASLIIITGRDDKRLATITDTLVADYPNTTFLPHKLDLSTLSASRESAHALLANPSIERIDILVANASGVFGKTKTTTPDGLEAHFAVNHLGHFVFINTLLPKLLVAARSAEKGATRVVVVSSIVTLFSPFRFHDYNLDGKPIPADEEPNWALLEQLVGLKKHDGYSRDVANGQSKTAMSLFAVQLSRLYADEGLYAFAIHPGAVQSRAGKEFLDSMTKEEKEGLTVSFDKDINQGAATILVAALDQGLTPSKGVFLNDCQVFEGVPGHSVDEKSAEKLWKLSEEIVKEKLGN